MSTKKINTLTASGSALKADDAFSWGTEKPEDGKPEKKDGYWSFAHDPRQAIGPYDYKPVNEYYKQMCKRIADYIEREEDLYADNGMDGADRNVFREIKNILEKVEEQKYLMKSFSGLADNIENTSAKFQRNLAELHKYCSLDEKEYVEAKEIFEDQLSSLQNQTQNTAMLITAISLQFEAMNKMIEGYKNKEGILGDK